MADLLKKCTIQSGGFIEEESPFAFSVRKLLNVTITYGTREMLALLIRLPKHRLPIHAPPGSDLCLPDTGQTAFQPVKKSWLPLPFHHEIHLPY